MKACTLLSVAAMLCMGCEFVESASEVTFGEGQINRIQTEIGWPDPDQLAGRTGDEDSLPGFPDSLQKSTLAHLAGALAASGECRQIVPFGQSEENTLLVGGRTIATVCSTDKRCQQHCPEGFLGMLMDVEVDFLLADKEQLEELQSQIEGVDENAIVQIRLQFFELEMFQVVDEEREITNDKFQDFELNIRDGGGPEVELVKQRHLADIDPDTPRRFDIDSRSDFSTQLKRKLLAGEESAVTMVQRFKVPRENMYSLQVDGAGLAIDMQPELVINVLDVAQSKL